MVAWDQPVCSRLLGIPITSRCTDALDFPGASTYQLGSRIPTREWPTLLRPPIAQTRKKWYRNINLFSITYAFRPRLRNRLTLRRLTLLRNPEVYGGPDFHRHSRYSCQHNLFPLVDQSLRSGFILPWNAPLPLPRPKAGKAVASVMCLSPVGFSAQIHLTSELLRFL